MSYFRKVERMNMYYQKIFVLTAALVFLTLSTGALANADSPVQGTIKVDGLSCPFCAYGLEKKLKAVSWIENTVVYVDAGKAEFSVKNPERIKLEDLNKAVKKGGFTPNGITFKATGSIEQSESKVILLLKDAKSVFLLAENKKRKALLKELNGEPRETQVEGTVKEIDGKLFLTIDKYKLL